MGRWGGPPLVWALQRGEKPLAPAGNRTVLPWMYSLQWLSYTGLPVISSKSARAGQNFRRTAKKSRSHCVQLWEQEDVSRSSKHRMKWKRNAKAITSPTYVQCNQQVFKCKFFIRPSAHPNVLMTYNESEERNQCSVGTLLMPVETSGAWQRCGLTGVRRLSLDLHNHRYRTASSLSGTRSWCRTCFHNWGRLYSL